MSRRRTKLTNPREIARVLSTTDKLCGDLVFNYDIDCQDCPGAKACDKNFNHIHQSFQKEYIEVKKAWFKDYLTNNKQPSLDF